MRGTVEYKDDQMIVHPPTVRDLQCARLIKQLGDINQVNNITIQQLQTREQDVLMEVEALRKELSDAKETIAHISGSNTAGAIPVPDSGNTPTEGNEVPGG
jgi:hypothetical protein